ncbi:MAG: hypothetical protein ABSB94_05790 [Syntrophorhabdales bacterium]
MAKRRAGLARHDWVTYCAMCRDSLALAGGKAVHILDLIFGGPEGWKTAPRAGPGYSRVMRCAQDCERRCFRRFSARGKERWQTGKRSSSMNGADHE